MIGYGVYNGKQLRWRQTLGLILALAGLTGFLLPGVAAPPLRASALMLGAGVAWSIYSLFGKGGGDPLRATAANFMGAALPAALLGIGTSQAAVFDMSGIGYAIASGALTSGIGYAIWYSALPSLSATRQQSFSSAFR
jgi:drug/metabolite transporter (DMT)-like permease